MKVAVLHNFIDCIGGGEKFAIRLAQELNADLYSCNVNDDVIKNIKDPNKPLKVINLGPLILKPPFKQISCYIKFNNLKLKEKYDLIIVSGEWTLGAVKPNLPIVYYCHSPVREFFDLYDFFIRRMSLFKRPIFWIWKEIHSRILKAKISDIKLIFANSENVQKRIKKYYSKDSVVLHPFNTYIEKNMMSKKETIKHISNFGLKYKSYWLTVQRLYPAKRIDFLLKLMKLRSNDELVILGGVSKGDFSSKYASYCKRIAPKNVRFLSDVSEEHLNALYSGAIGTLNSSKDEDFGLIPIESLNYNIPSIAPKEGGFLETILNGKTGFLVNLNLKDFSSKMDEVLTKQFDKDDFSKLKSKFSKEEFIKKLIKLSKKQILNK